jgi:hypothetical protein
MDNVMTNGARNKAMNLRISNERHLEFKVAADLRGAKMSGLLHQFIVKTIREEKERDPIAFEQALLTEKQRSEAQDLLLPVSSPANVVYSEKKRTGEK